MFFHNEMKEREKNLKDNLIKLRSKIPGAKDNVYTQLECCYNELLGKNGDE